MDLCDILEEALQVTIEPLPHADLQRDIVKRGVQKDEPLPPPMPPSKQRRLDLKRHPTVWAEWLREQFLGHLSKKVKPTTPLRIRSFCSGLGTEAFALKARFHVRMCFDP